MTVVLRGLGKLGVVAALVGAWLLFAGNAFASYIVQPANGATVGPKPTFLVYLDSSDTLAEVYVATSPNMSFGFPVNEIGSCIPNVSIGVTNQYTCQPTIYTSTFTSTLAPGTYYWSMTYFHPDPSNFNLPSEQVSGPFQFTVAAASAPAGVYLSTPVDGAAVTLPTKLGVNVPGGVGMHFYVGLSSARQDDGSPLGLTIASCSGQSDTASIYTCDVEPNGELFPGETYYWWVVIDASDGSSWVYGPRTFTVRDATSSSSGASSGSGSSTQSRTALDAPYLPAAAKFTGVSIKDTRLSKATYAVSKFLGAPKMVDVACWSDTDWPSVSGDSGDGYYEELGFYLFSMPHWIDLSPSICRAISTLLNNRPQYPNRIIANGMDTLTHEMVHALGYKNEAQTECYAMQLSIVFAVQLGVPYSYANELSHLSLQNYAAHPPEYQDYARCREGGAWDLIPNHPSPPWHSYR